MDKRIFHLYRYQIIPNERIQERLNLNENDLSVEETIERKNEFFIEAFRSLICKEDTNQEYELASQDVRIKEKTFLDFDNNDQEFYTFIAAVKRSMTKDTPDFQSVREPSWPRIYLLMLNRKDEQIIAIEHRTKVFRNTDSIMRQIETRLNEKLLSYNLNTKIYPLFNKQSFWDLIRGKAIEKVEFTMVTPNMANISKSLSDDLKNLARYSNSAVTDLTLTAPEHGVLNINEENQSINNLVQYSSEGGGKVGVKLKGVKKMQSTDNNNKHVSIDEVDITGNPSYVSALLRQLLK